MNIESDQEGEETILISTPAKPSTAPIPLPSTASILEQDRKINKLIDDLTKSDDERMRNARKLLGYDKYIFPDDVQ
ncbi:hypothetical protein PVK06_011687 [Gossypium arboreum]|uniref:Uncharacterized protein n=1 Tax=Gossypium arboreum TaxID=29729 RepID=A0ABR0Q9E3_GOSAR|nr:hypothetical protein PVK06_011687 [Gossypium arboreum]